MPMLRRSCGEKRSKTWLLRSMKSWSMFRPVQGLRESFLLARRPPVTSTETPTAPADVLLDLVAEIREELLARVALDLALERIEQHQHRRGDDRLLDVVRGDLPVLLDELRREGLVAEGAAGQAGQLAVVAVVEDREELAVAREVVGEAGAGQRVRDRVRGEARLALLAVGDDRLAGRLEALDGVLGGLVLQRLELRPGDLAVVEVLVGVLQLLRTRKRANELGGDRHALSACRVVP